MTAVLTAVRGGMRGRRHRQRGTGARAESVGFWSQRTQLLHQKKKKHQKWSKVTGWVLHCGGLSVITIQLLSSVLLSHDRNPCINVRSGSRV